MRGKNPKKRILQPDALYKSRVLNRLINVLMIHGKKSLSERLIYSAMAKLSDDKKIALTMFEQAVKNVMPAQEVRSRRIGGATYQVPVPVKHDRSEALALKWIVGAARTKKGKSMDIKLFEELKNANEGVGSAVKKREDVHKMAEANRAFAHFKF